VHLHLHRRRVTYTCHGVHASRLSRSDRHSSCCSLLLHHVLIRTKDKNDEALVLLADCVSTLSARSPDAPYVFGSYASALLRAGKEQEAENYATQGLALRYC
jgi:hypothetical protein